VVCSELALAAASSCGVMTLQVSKRAWMISGVVPQRRPVSLSIKLARQSALRAVLICCKMVRWMKLQALNGSNAGSWTHLASAI
jgi:hypothetical protein